MHHQQRFSSLTASNPNTTTELHSLLQTFLNDILSFQSTHSETYFLDINKNFHLSEAKKSLIFPIKGRILQSRLYLAPELTEKVLNQFSKKQLEKIDIWMLGVLAMKRILGQVYKPITSDQSDQEKKRTIRENLSHVKKKYNIHFAELFSKMTCIEPDQRLTIPDIQKRLDQIQPPQEGEKQAEAEKNSCSYSINITESLDIQSSVVKNYEEATLENLMELIKARRPEKYEFIKIHLQGCKLRESDNFQRFMAILRDNFYKIKTLHIEFEDENGANEQATSLTFSLDQEASKCLKSLHLSFENCKELNIEVLIDFMFKSNLEFADLESLELNLQGCSNITDNCINVFLDNVISEKLKNLSINAKNTKCLKGTHEVWKEFPILQNINSTVLI